MKGHVYQYKQYGQPWWICNLVSGMRWLEEEMKVVVMAIRFGHISQRITSFESKLQTLWPRASWLKPRLYQHHGNTTLPFTVLIPSQSKAN